MSSRLDLRDGSAAPEPLSSISADHKVAEGSDLVLEMPERRSSRLAEGETDRVDDGDQANGKAFDIDGGAADRAGPGAAAAEVVRPTGGDTLAEASFEIDDGTGVGRDVASLADPGTVGSTPRVAPRTVSEAEALIRDLGDLVVGAPIVHADHGVGRYRGLARVDCDAGETEFLAIDYADEKRLYVPLDTLYQVARYGGADEADAPLHELDGNVWPKLRRRVAERVVDVARELIARESRREAAEGRAIVPDPKREARFAASFPHEPTPDQRSAIAAVLFDLASSRPMDRLVCGDVGFGKTEVAMRAAFAAVDAGVQVAVIVPTTLLARQHHESFVARFAEHGARIARLSRLESAAETTDTLERLATGEIDIVIGTHALLGEEVAFADLGLVVVDEEQRFGAAHKAQLGLLRDRVDLLTLSATPIPRTLGACLSGLRSLSLVTTPPRRRHPIETAVVERDRSAIAEALRAELERGGQAFFLHDAVASIDAVAEEVRTLVPDARVRVAHGQMSEETLEDTMLDFVAHRFDVLVATTIIESGIDVPNANTIVVDRADRLGLAQLHQLRGRVGRSEQRAKALLLTPPRASLTAEARRRLDAIASNEELGSGFALALHDLEIRGVGRLLGEAQSGQMRDVGFALYGDLLEQAARDLRAGREPDPERPFAARAAIDLGEPANLPVDYVADDAERLVACKRIASADDESALDAVERELAEDHGTLPPDAARLIAVARLRRRAERCGIRRIEARPDALVVTFGDRCDVDVEVLAERVGEEESWSLEGAELRIARASDDGRSGAARVAAALDALSPGA